MLKSERALYLIISCVVFTCILTTSPEHTPDFPDNWWGNFLHDIAWGLPAVAASIGIFELYSSCSERSFGTSVSRTLLHSILAGGSTLFIQVAFHGYRVLFELPSIRTRRELLVFSVLLVAYLVVGTAYAWFNLKAPTG